MDTDTLSFWLNRWLLIPDGEKFITPTSTLLPVKTATQGIKAMLKVTDDADEQTGNSLMAWWEGNGAAQVLAYEKKLFYSLALRERQHCQRCPEMVKTMKPVIFCVQLRTGFTASQINPCQTLHLSIAGFLR